MLTRSQQAEFRPLFKRAWSNHCEQTALSVEDALSRDVWYREQILSATAGRVRSTKLINGEEFASLLSRLRMLADDETQVEISGWTPAQNTRFIALATKAYEVARSRAPVQCPEFRAWVGNQLNECGYFLPISPDRKEGFDKVMSHLAIIAGDEYWMDKTSRASEDRMRWQIGVMLQRLSDLEDSPRDWSYARGIYGQADLLPHDINDAPAQILWKVLQMLDTHIRRLERNGRAQHPDLAAVPF